MRRAQLAAHHRCLSKLTVTTEPCQSHASGVLPERTSTSWGTDTHSSMLDEKRQPLKQHRIDTEAGMLLGISQKHNMRSSPCRFTEFCNSQCLSHFAAPFIVARTETSIAKSCKLFMAFSIDGVWNQVLFCGMLWQWVWTSMRNISPNPPPMSICKGIRKTIPKQTSQTNSKVYFLNMCEWSFRRFTYGNLVTTSPSSKW